MRVFHEFPYSIKFSSKNLYRLCIPNYSHIRSVYNIILS